MKNLKKYFSHQSAFTLAEVLVTLGIVGIVMAMLIPSLINRYKTYVLQQQFKRAYAAISVAIEKTQFDLGENVKCNYGASGSWTDCQLFYRELAKQMNVIKACEGNALQKKCLPPGGYRPAEEVRAENNPNDDFDAAKEFFIKNCGGYSSASIENKNFVYVLNGGFTIITYSSGAPLFLLDINGEKKPNKWGYDLFEFQLVKRKTSESSIVLKPTSGGCMVVEKGGFTSQDFFNRVNRGNANF